MNDKKTVLVVEDENRLLKVIEQKFADKNVNVLSARTAEQAIECLENNDCIDAIWLDHYLLGETRGIEVLAKVKQVGSIWKEIPVFVVTNTADEEKMREYLELGADKTYVKSEIKLNDVTNEIVALIT